MTKKNKKEKEEVVKKAVKEVKMTFDTYFQHLMGTGNIQTHHFAAIKSFMDDKGLKLETKDKFDKAFNNY